MIKKDYVYLALLTALAAFIWLRDTSWATQLDDTLPILIALPLFFWLDWPWKFEEGEFTLTPRFIYMGIGTLVLGILSNLTVLLSIGWCLLLWGWIQERVSPSSRHGLLRMMILPFMAFPWVTLDAHSLGWCFRLSGAWASAQVLSLSGFEVLHQGTRLLVNGIPISVEAACAGLNTLQSMLIAGSILAYLQLGKHWIYWVNLPLLFVMAWIANTMRILTLSLAAVLVSPEFAMGPFHDAGGWGVLVLMFLLCWGIFSLQQRLIKPPSALA